MNTQLLVIGAGPYGLSTAALARDCGIETVVVGRPMGFWRQNMPAGMYLRSGADWHLDGAAVHTLAAYLEERRIAARDVDPIPIELFLDYAEWFRENKAIDVVESLVTGLVRRGDRFEATLDDGGRVVAGSVVAAPGICHYKNLPAWSSRLPPGVGAHTCELIDFGDLAGQRVLIVGGRQSAYEWAALIREHGAERIDIVHRHDVPRFDRVSWTFVDPYIEQTVNVPGYWRNLAPGEQDAVARRFWEVGRLTLEHWLVPRLRWVGLRRWPGTEVVTATPGNGAVQIGLSSSARLDVDRVVFATGYRAELGNVTYLAGVLDEVARADGFPVLDEAFQTTCGGLYITGFSATRDFGPFFGFVRGSPAAATLIVRDLCARR